MPQHIDRRDFLRLAGLSGTAALAGWGGTATRAAAACSTRPGLAPLAVSTLPATTTRVLVVIEMGGGNDGFSMVPPVDGAALAALRPTTMPDPAALVDVGGGVLVHPGLSALARRGVIAVEGVGSVTPDGSHFEMMRRWWMGDAASAEHATTGMLGRLCDLLDQGAPVTGLSIGGASSPALANVSAGTLGLPDPGMLWWLMDPDDDWSQTYCDALATMAGPSAGDSSMTALVRRNLASALESGAIVRDVAAQGDGSGRIAGQPDGALAEKLALAVQVLSADIGVRVIHVPFGGDFDTHEDHAARHAWLMEEFGAAASWFADELDRRGLGDDVLVMTTSEFGRRPAENGDAGLDHGTASTMMITGPVASGRVGEPVDFARLDDEGNPAVPVSLDRYIGGVIEEWFGVPATEVVDAEPLALGIGASVAVG